MSPPEPVYPPELTEHSKTVLESLHVVVPDAILIGGWGTWIRVHGDPSHDVDLIVTHPERDAVAGVASDFGASSHVGGRKWRASVDGIHVDLYVPFESRLGAALRLRTETLAEHREVVDGWNVLDASGHAATKLAALIDRPESLPGEKDRAELWKLIPGVDPVMLSFRLRTCSELPTDQLRSEVRRGLEYLRDLRLSRTDRARLARFISGVLSGLGV